MNIFRRIARNDRGAAAVEYGLIVALIVLAMVSALTEFAGTTTNMWNDVRSNIDGK
ncbi:MAG TPA: Flp family type IVb pilin [Allosphingosinicella sp.]